MILIVIVEKNQWKKFDSIAKIFKNKIMTLHFGK